MARGVVALAEMFRSAHAFVFFSAFFGFVGGMQNTKNMEEKK